MRCRELRSSSSCARSSACRRAFSSAKPAAAVTASSSPGSDSSASSCSSAAIRCPSRSIGVIARPGRGSTSTGCPSASAYASYSGSQKATVERRVVQRAGERPAQVRGRDVAPQAHEQVADPQVGEPRPRHLDEHRDRDRDEGAEEAPDQPLRRLLGELVDDEDRREHQQRDAADERGRQDAAARHARVPPAPGDQRRQRQLGGDDEHTLDGVDGVRRGGARPDQEQVGRLAGRLRGQEREPHELERKERERRRGGDPAVGRGRQPALRERHEQQHEQEDRRVHEQDPDRRRQRRSVVDRELERERGEAAERSEGDHQRADGIGGPAPPDHEPAADERQRQQRQEDPLDQRRLARARTPWARRSAPRGRAGARPTAFVSRMQPRAVPPSRSPWRRPYRRRLRAPSSSASRPASSSTGTPSFSALASLEPGDAPATTYDVFLDTEPVTLPPAAMIRSWASSRVRSGSVPVSTKVWSRSGPSPGGGPSCSRWSPICAQVVEQRAHLLVGELVVDQLGHDRADPGRLRDLLRRGRQQGVDRAELGREVAAGDVADALDADREQHDAERPVLRRLDRRDEVAGADLAVALELAQLLLGEPVEVPRRADQAALEERRHLLLPQAVDVHHRGERRHQLPAALGAVAVRALGEHARALDGRRVAERAPLRRASAPARGPCARPRAEPARRPAG